MEKILTAISKKSIFLIVLIFLSVLFFAPSISPSFSSDDYRHLENNIYYKDAVDALKVFSEFDGREYRPIVRYSLWLNYQFARNAIPFKITNILFHASCVILLYFILLNIINNETKSFFGTLVFCVLPIHSASVNFIMGRTDILCAFFYLSSLLFLLKSETRRNEIKRLYHMLSVVFFSLALASKEMAITLPATASLILYLFYSKRDVRKRFAFVIRKTFFFWALGGGYVVIRIIYWANNPESIDGYTNYSIAHIIKNYFFWFFAMIYPSDLYLARFHMENHVAIFSVATCSTAVLIFLALRYVTNKKSIRGIISNKIIFLALTWFVLSLSPIMGGNAHRWYLYLPSISLSFLMIGLLTLSQERKKAFIAFTSIFLLTSAFELTNRTNNWRVHDSISKNFVNQLEKTNAFQEKEFYLINTPFGYRNTYLFTWGFLDYAISIFTKNKPRIYHVSYLSVSDKKTLSYEKIDSKVVVSLEPNHYIYVFFNRTQRKFSEGEEIRVKDLLIKILSVNIAGLVEKYEIFLPKEKQIPVLFYDGSTLIIL